MSDSASDGEQLAALRAALARGTRIALKAWGRSMLPTIWPGSMVPVEPVEPSQIRVGDVLLIDRGRTVQLHRATSVGGGKVVTQGDHCRYADPPIELREVLGRVRGVPLGWLTLHLPASVALSATRRSAVPARWLGQNLHRLRSAWCRVASLGPIRKARRRLAGWHVEPLDGAPSELRALLLRRARHPSSEALARLDALAKRGDAFVAHRRGRPVGYAAIQAREEAVGWLELWVDVSAWGLGVEHELMTRIVARARAAGLRELRTKTRASRVRWMGAAALRFRELAREGTAPDAVVMARVLS